MVPFLLSCCAILAAALVWQARRHAGLRKEWRAEVENIGQEHANTERALEAHRDAMLNALSDPLFLVDSDGVIRFANVSAGELFRGRTLLNRRLREVFLDERLSAPILDAIAGQSRLTLDVILPRQASPLGSEDHRGETAWVVDAAPITSMPSENNLTCVTLRDITTEYQTDQIRKDFVANASHELRTPLAIINGYLENLIDDDAVDDPRTARRFLKIMRKHGDRIARIVEDMLIISRLESGEAGSLKLKPFSLEACVRDVLERLESVINAQGAKVTIDAKVTDLVMTGDRFYWTQVLFNLVENALKQNPEIPLKVQIGWDRAPQGEFRIWVSDNGIGIPAADLPFIFRRFYRVEKHHSQVEIKGTGLGLSIVKRAIEAHRGEIAVTSTPGRETRFEIRLPSGVVVTPKPAPAEEAKAG